MSKTQSESYFRKIKVKEKFLVKNPFGGKSEVSRIVVKLVPNKWKQEMSEKTSGKPSRAVSVEKQN